MSLRMNSALGQAKATGYPPHFSRVSFVQSAEPGAKEASKSFTTCLPLASLQERYHEYREQSAMDHALTVTVVIMLGYQGCSGPPGTAFVDHGPIVIFSGRGKRKDRQVSYMRQRSEEGITASSAVYIPVRDGHTVSQEGASSASLSISNQAPP
jgi:hypothetical protein